MSFHEERMDVFAEALKKTITAVGDCADIITKVGQRIDALVVRMDAMVARMDKTDERWNQFIDRLVREHQNGRKKHQPPPAVLPASLC